MELEKKTEYELSNLAKKREYVGVKSNENGKPDLNNLFRLTYLGF